MWYADDNFSKDEQLILKELEYDLFRCNPGFRAMWRDNFNEYFKGTLNEEYWRKREKTWLSARKLNHRKIGFKDYEYAHMIEDIVEFKHETAGGRITAFSNDPQFEKRIKAALERSNNKLLKLARAWAEPLAQQCQTIYEKTRNINCFRVFINAPYVPSKIVFATAEDYEGNKFESDLEWRTDKIGFSLALACLRRSLESLQCLQANPLTKTELDYKDFISRGSHLENLLNDALSKIIYSVLTKNCLK